MSSDRDAWIGLFQANQRQILEAHEAYQRAMAEGHAAFLEAMARSQAVLAAAIRGELDPAELDDLTRRVGLDAAMGANPSPSESDVSSALAPTVERVGPAAVDAPREDAPWSGCAPGARIGVVPDAFGVGERLVAKLAQRGWAAELATDGMYDSLIVLAGLLDDPRALARGRGLSGAAPWLGRARHTVVVGDMGGRFGLDQLESFRAMHAGLLSLARDFGAKFVDLDVGYRPPDDAAQDLLVELLQGGDVSPVGLPEGGRVVLVEEPVDVRRVPRGTAGDPLTLLVTTDPLLAARAARRVGRLAVLGVHVADATFSREIALDQPMDVFEAVADVQAKAGGVSQLVFAFPPSDEALVDRGPSIAGVLHTVFASTASDPVGRIGLWMDAGDSAATLGSWVVLAEAQRRGEECVTVSVVSSVEHALEDLFDTEGAVLWHRR